MPNKSIRYALTLLQIIALAFPIWAGFVQYSIKNVGDINNFSGRGFFIINVLIGCFFINYISKVAIFLKSNSFPDQLYQVVIFLLAISVFVTFIIVACMTWVVINVYDPDETNPHYTYIKIAILLSLLNMYPILTGNIELFTHPITILIIISFSAAGELMLFAHQQTELPPKSIY